MKRFFVFKLARTIVLTSAVALFAVAPAFAQAPSSTQGDSSAGYTSGRSDRDNGTDWGWLGLLGLAGLLGLIPKRRRVEADYRATDSASRATAR